MQLKERVVIVGGGACALFLSALLDPKIYQVHIYEKNAALARKFLVAGQGGLNLTHSENPLVFATRYTPPNFLQAAFSRFNNNDFIKWLSLLGIETFVGSSGRVFPLGKIKPAKVLDIIVSYLLARGVKIHYKYKWLNFASDGLVFENGGTTKTIKADYFVFCLGGASWSVTGSNGEWLEPFKKVGIDVKKFEASNSSFVSDWPKELLNQLAGQAIKNTSFSVNNFQRQGEAVITGTGIEGSGVYPFSPIIRNEILKNGVAQMYLDFKPTLSIEQVTQKLSIKNSSLSMTDLLRSKLSLSKAQIAIIKTLLPKADFSDVHQLSRFIKSVPLPIVGTGPMDEAISTVGGIELNEVDEYFQLRKIKDVYAIGEMLNYDAPTGGYLLQSCFSMSAWLATHLNELNT